MRKVIITLAFNDPEQVQKAVKRLKDTQDISTYEYYIIDVGFPIPCKRKNFKRLCDIANAYDVDILKPARNRGVSGNWMWAVYELGLEGNDVIIGMDPDSEPQQRGWCDALTDVLSNSMEPIAYCGLTRITPPQLSTEVNEFDKPYTTHMIAGRKVRKYMEAISWPMGGFNAGFVRERGIHQPRTRYGFIEMGTIRLMENTKWDWCMLDEFHDATSDRGDKRYQEWKIKQARAETHLDFEDYLKGIK